MATISTIVSVDTLEGMITALNALSVDAKARGYHPSCIYTGLESVSITETILTDGSKVCDLFVIRQP